MINFYTGKTITTLKEFNSISNEEARTEIDMVLGSLAEAVKDRIETAIDPDFNEGFLPDTDIYSIY